MHVIVTGEARDLPGPCTVEGLLETLGLADRPCAVEVNRAVVPKAEHGAVSIAEGDRVEVVTLVGGG